jgi:outer membrane protein
MSFCCRFGLKITILLALIFVLLEPGLAPSIFSQEGTSVKYLTMEEAVSRALVKNNQVLAGKFALQRAVWDKRNAWTQLFPYLSLNSRMMRIDNQTFAERDFRRYLPEPIRSEIPQTVFQESFYTSLDLTLPVFNSALLNSIAIANSNKNMAESMSLSTRQNIIYQVVNTYLAILKSKDILQLQRDYLDLSQMNYDKAERMYNAGRFSKSEALRWKVDLQQQKSVVVSNEAQLRSQMKILNRLLNIKFDEEIEIQSGIPEQIENESQKLLQMTSDELLHLIEVNDEQLVKVNAALQAARSNTETSKNIYRNTIASYLPNVSLSYSYGWRENNTMALDDYSPKTLMLNLQMPLFTSFQNYTAVKSSYYQYRQSQADFNDQLQSTRFVLTETVNNLIELKTQRELSQVSLEYSDFNYRIVEQQKEQGLVSNLDFIDAKLNLQNAKLNDISVHHDFIAGMVELYYLLGKVDVLWRK